jgi:AcrR family transcriptional regulator
MEEGPTMKQSRARRCGTRELLISSAAKQRCEEFRSWHRAVHAEAGLTHGWLNRHFGSKEELGRSLRNELVRSAESVIRSEFLASSPLLLGYQQF